MGQALRRRDSIHQHHHRRKATTRGKAIEQDRPSRSHEHRRHRDHGQINVTEEHEQEQTSAIVIYITDVDRVRTRTGVARPTPAGFQVHILGSRSEKLNRHLPSQPWTPEGTVRYVHTVQYSTAQYTQYRQYRQYKFAEPSSLRWRKNATPFGEQIARCSLQWWGTRSLRRYDSSRWRSTVRRTLNRARSGRGRKAILRRGGNLGRSIAQDVSVRYGAVRGGRISRTKDAMSALVE